jgi:type III secretion protein R
MKKILFFIFLIIANGLFAQTSPEDAAQQPDLVTKMAVLAGLGVLPFAVMLRTSFVKIVVVLSLLRNAIGVQQTPPNPVINGVALLLSIYVMFPTGVAMYEASKDVIVHQSPAKMLSEETTGYILAVMDKAKEPLKQFLQKNSSVKHIKSFHQIAYKSFPEPYKSSLKTNDFLIIIPSFITTQLKAAFEIGVLIYLPFFVIDLVVSNILLAMGMMMLSPLTIALPIKLLLIVMLDGWTILVQGLVLTFR